MLLDSSPKASPWCAEICNAANRPGSNRRSTPDLFRARFASATTSRPPQTNTTRPASPSSSPPTQDCEPAAMPSKNSTASTKPTTTMAPSKLSTGSTDLYATGQLGEFHHAHRRHHHCRGRPDLGLARKRPALQRPNRRNQQPPPNPTPRRPRLHQPPQLRRPRTPRNMITPDRCQQPSIPRKRRSAS